MRQRFGFQTRKPEIIVVAALVGSITLALCCGAVAQPGQRPGPPFGGPGGLGGPGDRGRGGFGGPRPATVMRIPVGALNVGLKLSAAQKTKIGALQKQLEQRREALMPRPQFGEDGGPPDFEKMRAAGGTFRALEQSVTQKITAILTADQKKALPGLLKEADGMRSVGLPLELAYSLHLSAAQKAKVTGIARMAQQKRDAARKAGNDGNDGPGGGGPGGGMRGEREKAHREMLAVLTDAQRLTVSAYEKSHPRPRFSGGFRPGGPPPM